MRLKIDGSPGQLALPAVSGGPYLDGSVRTQPTSAAVDSPAVNTTIFEQWTNNRQVASFGTNDGSPRLAFQAWHHFKEAFPPELIRHAVGLSDLDVSWCLDPFGGSGTTALACQMLGINSTTIEVNPFLTDVIRAKLREYDLDRITSALAEVRKTARRDGPTASEYFSAVPPTFLEPGVSNRWIFNEGTAGRLAAILNAIDGLSNSDDQRLLRVIIGGMLTQVSNVIVSGKGRRYRRNWRTAGLVDDYVDALFAQRAQVAIRDLRTFSARPQVDARVLRADSRKLKADQKHQIAIMSPPYPNSFDYTDVYNLELWMLGYLRESADNRLLRTATLTSHVQLARDYPQSPNGSPLLDSTLDQLDKVKGKLWSPWIPAMIGGYFADLLTVLAHVRSSLDEQGKCWMVVGDSSYSGTPIPVAKILQELAPAHGWHVAEARPFRHMKSSAQQGWRANLAESIVVLSKR